MVEKTLCLVFSGETDTELCPATLIAGVARPAVDRTDPVRSRSLPFLEPEEAAVRPEPGEGAMPKISSTRASSSRAHS